MGTELAGRYRLEERLRTTASSDFWRAVDTTLDRTVGVRLVSPATAEDAMDAARRAAMVDEPALLRVLDVAQEDGDTGPVTYVVTEFVEADSLADLLRRDGPLPADRVRALVGETAQVLSRVAASGLHHEALEPTSVLRTPGGELKLEGLGVDAAAEGRAGAPGEQAARTDAVALVALVYAGLTGHWPLDGEVDGLEPAPRIGGTPVPPGDVVSGVPNDLDTLCAVTFGHVDDGPLTPEEVVENLRPWTAAEEAAAMAAAHDDGPATEALPVADVPRPDRERGADRGGVDDQPPRARTPSAPPAGCGRPAGSPRAAPVRGRRLLVPPAPRSSQARPVPRRPAGGQVHPSRRPATPSTPPRSPGPTCSATTQPARTGDVAAVPPAHDEAAHDRRPTPRRGRPGRRTTAGTTAEWDDEAQWSDGDARRRLRLRGRGRRGASAGTRRSRPDPDRRPMIALAVLAVLVVVGLVLALQAIGGIGGGDDVTTEPTGGTTGSSSAAPSTSGTDAAPTGPVPQISGVRTLDPQGGDGENDETAPRAIDDDPSSFWKSSTYKSAEFGGLKDGLGMVVTLSAEAPVSSVTAQVSGSGGVLEVRTAPGPGPGGLPGRRHGDAGLRHRHRRAGRARHHPERDPVVDRAAGRLGQLPDRARGRDGAVTPPGPGEGDELDGRSDHELLAAHVDGDGEAFGVLVQRHRSRLWAVAVRTMRDPEDAADALQDAMVSAYRGAASFRGDSAVTTWLHRVVVNACLDRMRREKVRPTVPLPEHHDPASTRDEHAGTDARLDVMAALARLPEGHRTAIVLVDLQELSVAEAAEVLGVAEGTVKSRCSRGRAMLAELLRPAPERGAAATSRGNREGNRGGTGSRARASNLATHPSAGRRPDRPAPPAQHPRPPRRRPRDQHRARRAPPARGGRRAARPLRRGRPGVGARGGLRALRPGARRPARGARRCSAPRPGRCRRNPPDLGARIAAALAAEPPLRPGAARLPTSLRSGGGTGPRAARSSRCRPVAAAGPPTWRSPRAWRSVGLGGTYLVGTLGGGGSDAGTAAEVSSAEGRRLRSAAPRRPASPSRPAASPTWGSRRATGTSGPPAPTTPPPTWPPRRPRCSSAPPTGWAPSSPRRDAQEFAATGREDCLAALGRAGAEPAATDVATYEGQQAVVLVLPSGRGYDVLVVPVGCGSGDDRVLAETRLR